jgi:hypothetical protein
MTRLGPAVLAVVLALMAGAGCASVSPERGHDQVSAELTANLRSVE